MGIGAIVKKFVAEIGSEIERTDKMPKLEEIKTRIKKENPAFSEKDIEYILDIIITKTCVIFGQRILSFKVEKF